MTKYYLNIGLHLDEETRQKTKELKEKISDLQIEFSKNCNEESTKLDFTLEQLGNYILKPFLFEFSLLKS